MYASADVLVLDPPPPDTPEKQAERAARARQAHAQQALRDSASPFPQIVASLVTLVGAPLAAYLGNVNETRAVRQWMSGERVPHPTTQTKLQLALQIASFLAKEEGYSDFIAAWFQGMNPALEDKAPAELIRESAGGTELSKTTRRILAAAKEFADH